MMIDASAIVAILLREDDAAEIAARIEAERARRLTTPLAVWESAIRLARVKKMSAEDAHFIVAEFLREAAINVVSVTPTMAALAVEVAGRYTKSLANHPADLNFGDCFIYAAAKEWRVPLLYKGKDFAQTDVNDKFR